MTAMRTRVCKPGRIFLVSVMRIDIRPVELYRYIAQLRQAAICLIEYLSSIDDVDMVILLSFQRG